MAGYDIVPEDGYAGANDMLRFRAAEAPVGETYAVYEAGCPRLDFLAAARYGSRADAERWVARRVLEAEEA